MPRRRRNGKAGAHRRTAKVRIDPACRLRVSARLQVGALATVQPNSARTASPCAAHPRNFCMPGNNRRVISNTETSLKRGKGRKGEGRASGTGQVAIEGLSLSPEQGREATGEEGVAEFGEGVR